MEFHQKIAVLLDTRKPNNCDYAKNKFNSPSEIISTHCVSRKEVPSPISNISQEEMQKLRKLVRIYCPFNFNHATKVKIKVFFVKLWLIHMEKNYYDLRIINLYIRNFYLPQSYEAATFNLTRYSLNLLFSYFFQKINAYLRS